MSSITQSQNQYMVDGVPHERAGWSDEEAAFVKEKWFTGWSAGQIANRLEGRTRNAVIGLIARRHWDRTRNNTNQHPKPKQLDISRHDTPADGAGVSLLELTNCTCRWPKGTPGEPDFTFCGHPSADLSEGRPYCAEHTRRAHE